MLVSVSASGGGGGGEGDDDGEGLLCWWGGFSVEIPTNQVTVQC